LVTRDGRKVTEFHFFETTEKPVFVAVVDKQLYGYNSDGTYTDSDTCNVDLFMASKTYYVAVHVLPDGHIMLGKARLDKNQLKLQIFVM
jgi:hypothetical protein